MGVGLIVAAFCLSASLLVATVVCAYVARRHYDFKLEQLKSGSIEFKALEIQIAELDKKLNKFMVGGGR